MIHTNHSVIIGADHAGFALKEQLKAFMTQEKLTVIDVGTRSEASVDYPDYGARVARAVSSGEHERGILLCGTGIGMSMVANKYAGVRAALCNDLYTALMSRRHNDANILVLGGRVIGISLAIEIVRTWLNTPFDGGRHAMRIGMLERTP